MARKSISDASWSLFSQWLEYFAKVLKRELQQFSCRSTTVGTLHASSLQGFGYGDIVHQIVHQFEKPCNQLFFLITLVLIVAVVVEVSTKV